MPGRGQCATADGAGICMLWRACTESAPAAPGPAGLACMRETPPSRRDPREVHCGAGLTDLGWWQPPFYAAIVITARTGACWPPCCREDIYALPPRYHSSDIGPFASRPDGGWRYWPVLKLPGRRSHHQHFIGIATDLLVAACRCRSVSAAAVDPRGRSPAHQISQLPGVDPCLRRARDGLLSQLANHLRPCWPTFVADRPGYRIVDDPHRAGRTLPPRGPISGRPSATLGAAEFR